MQPVSMGGFFEEPLPVGTVGGGAAPTPNLPTDEVAQARVAEQKMPATSVEGGVSLASPRPWPRSAACMPDASAWPLLAGRGPAEVAAAMLSVGSLATALLPALEQHARKVPGQPRGPWDGEASGAGWRVPRNPSRTPMRPAFVLQVAEASDDVAPLRVVPNLSGRIRALRLQWPEEFEEPALAAQQATFRDVLTRMAADVTVHVVAEGVSADRLRQLMATWDVPRPQRVHIHSLQVQSSPERLYCPMTMWARDGAVLMRSREGQRVLLLPRSFRGDGQVDGKLNRVVAQGSGMAPALLGDEVCVRRSKLIFEGGDVVASRDAVLIGGNAVSASMGALRMSRAAVLELFAAEMGVKVVAIDPQPEFHIDVGFGWLGENAVAVADPRETLRRAAAMEDGELARMARVTEDRHLADGYDRAAAMLRDLGYEVARLPNLAGLGLSTPYLTYNNVLMENFQEVKRVFMPVYGWPSLDEAARCVYRDYGYAVVDMPSARLSTKLWGATRCATGDLDVTDWG